MVSSHENTSSAEPLSPNAASSPAPAPTLPTAEPSLLPPLPPRATIQALPAAGAPPLVPPLPLNRATHFLTLKLTHNNYLYWSSQIRPFLRGQGLYGYIDGSIPLPVAQLPGPTTHQAAEPNPEYLHWIQQDQQLLSLILSSLSEDVMALAVGYETSRSLWLALERSLAGSTMSRQLQLQAALSGLKQRDLPIAVYLSRAKVVFDEMAAIGKAPSREEFIVKVLLGLRDEFQDMATTIIAQPGYITFEEVHNLLLTQEFMASARNSAAAQDAAASPPVAAAAHFVQGSAPRSSSSGSGFRGRGGRNLTATGRGRRTGNARDYHRRFQPQRIQERDAEPRRAAADFEACQICSSTYHLAATCPRFLAAPLPQPPAAHFSSAQPPPPPRVPSSPMSSPVWYPDTGATHHITPDLAAL